MWDSCISTCYSISTICTVYLLLLKSVTLCLCYSTAFRYRLNAIGESFAETYGVSVPGDKLVTYDVLQKLSSRAHSDIHRHVSERGKLFMKLATERLWMDGR